MSNECRRPKHEGSSFFRHSSLAVCRFRRLTLACLCLLPSILVALWAAGYPLVGAAITINDFTATRNNRFDSGYYSGPLVANTDPSFIGFGYDWSGVGWDTPGGTQSFAMITPRQMLIANHYQPGIGQAIGFATAGGTVTTFTVQSRPGTHGGYPPDMATAQLSNPIPPSAGITSYSILFQGYNPSTYAGYNLLGYGQVAAIGWNQIAAVDTGTNFQFGSPFTPDSAYYMLFLYDSTSPDRVSLNGGDSGSPSFIVTGSPGVMYLAGGHYLSAPGQAGIDTFLPMSLPALDSFTSPAGYLPSVVTPATARWSGSLSSTWNAAGYPPGGGNWTLASSAAVFNDVLSGGTVMTCASVVFDGSVSPQHSITLSGSQAVTSLSFNLTPSTSAGFSFNGSPLTLGEAGLTNNDIHPQTFNNMINLRASQQWHAGSGGVNLSASGSLNLGADQLLYLDGSGTSDFEGVVSGQGSGVAKDGSGTLILGNAANSFSGPLFVHNGTLKFTSIQTVGGGNSALGAPTTAANGMIYLAGTLAYAGSGSSSDRVIDVADGPGATGATGIIDASGSGPLNLSGGAICENAAGGAPSGSQLVLQGAGSGSESGAIVNGGSINVLSLVKTGSGTWSLSGANTYTGTTTINGGQLAISGAIASSTALSISGGTVQLDDSALPGKFGSNRLGSQPISLQSGVLRVNLGNVSGGTETIGAVTATVGDNTVALAVSPGNGILKAGSLTRMPGATLNLTGVLSGSNGIVFSGMPSGSNFINAGTFVNGADYAVYDAAGFVRAMVAGSNAWDYAYDPSPAGMASRHVLIDTNYASQPSLSLLTLSLSGANAGYSLAAAQTLALVNGGILKTGGGTATISGGAGLSTTGEYVLRTDTQNDQLTINTPLGGGTGLTKAGLGTLVLGAAGNAYGGATTISAGTLRTTVAAAIPSSSPLVIGNAAALDLAGQPQTVSGITLYDGAVENSGPATTLVLSASVSQAGWGAGVTYAGAGNGGSISGGTLNLASSDSVAAAHLFSVARGQGSADLNILADIADGPAAGQSLVKTGNGLLQLTGTNSFSGGTQIQAGTLLLGSNYAIPAASSLTLAGGTLNLGGFANSAGTLVMQSGLITGNGSFSAGAFNLQGGTLAAALVGPGTLSAAGTGTVTISSSNNYSGGTMLSGGTLLVSADNNLGSTTGGLTLNGGTLQVVGTSFSSTTRPVTTTSRGGGITVADPDNDLTLATQNLTGSGALAKAGQGGLRLGGSIASAAITVEDGVLQLTGTASQLTASPALSLWNVATFALSNNNESVSAINLTGGTINTGAATLSLNGSLNYARSIWPASIEGNLSLAISGGAFAVNQGSSTDLTVAASISGNPAGGLAKTGNGTLLLSGSNTYGGGTNVGAGSLVAVAPASLPGYSSQSAVTVNAGAVLAVRTGDGVSGWNGGQIGSLLADAAWSNNTATLGIDTTNANFTYAGNISQAIAFTKLGVNNLTLSGSNTYSGKTTIAAGTLLVTTPASLPGYNAPGVVGVAGGAMLAVRTGDGSNGFSGAQLSSLVTNVSWANVVSPLAGLGIDTTNGNFAFAGNISQMLAVTKLGANTLTLSGSNTYSGGTAVAAGTLLAATPASLAFYNQPASVGVNGGAVLAVRTSNGLTGWGPSQIDTLVANAAWSDSTAGLGLDTSNGNFTYGSNITQALTLTKLGTNTLTLTGENSYGATSVLAGTLLAATTAALPGYNVPGSIVVAAGAVLAVPTGDGTIGWTAGQIGSLAASASWSNNTAALGLDTSSGNFTSSGSITQPLALTKLGANTLTLTGSNSYTGNTNIATGVLKLDFSQPGAPTANIINNAADASALALEGGTLAIQGNAGTLYSGSTANSQRFNGLVVGPGSSAIVLTSASSNSLVLNLGSISRSPGGTVDFTLPSGAQSASNGITTTTPNTAGILGGYATVSGTNWAAASGTAGNITAYSGYAGGDLGALASNATLNVAPSGAQTAVTTADSFNSLNLAGTVGITMSGSGSITLASGGLIGNTSGSISGGTLKGSASGDIVLITPANLIIGSAIADNGGATGLTKAGPGLLTLTGSNAYSGTTTIAAGTLQVGNGGAVGSLGSGGVIDDTALEFNLAGVSHFSGPISGPGNLIQSGPGTLVLSGTNNYTGTTIITKGTLDVLDTQALSNNGLLVGSNAGQLFALGSNQGSIAGPLGAPSTLGPGEASDTFLPADDPGYRVPSSLPSTTNAVPEPHGLLLSLVAAAGLLRALLRRR
jgi:fibronectin-binding autotransporter adhesin